MGYSVTIQIEDRDLRKKVLLFMARQYRGWEFLSGEVGCGSVSNVLGSKYISYGSKNHRSIGFNYSSPDDFERQYLYCVVNWLAINFGKQWKPRNGDAAYPMYMYDGYKRVVLFVEGEMDESLYKGGFQRVREDGWCEIFPYVRNFNEPSYLEFVEKTIREELNRLSEEWKKERT
jgi:hypothetical protein